MNIDKFLKIFVPKDHSFFPLFESASKNMVEAAHLLKELMATEDLTEHERLNTEIKRLEQIGDDITNKTYEQLNKSFITPFDREDIHELITNIDNVLDSIWGVSKRMCLYKPKRYITVYEDLTELILEASIEIEKAVVCLKDPAANIKKIRATCDKVSDIENLADEVYFKGISQLFEKEENPRELLKKNKIIETLESCVDEQKDITETIKSILIKIA